MKHSSEDLKYAFSDFLKLLKTHKKLLVTLSLVGMTLCFLLAVTRPVQYLLQSTFRDKGKTQANIHTSLTELLISPSSLQDSEAISVMQSRYLLSKVIKQLQIQGSINKIDTSSPALDNAQDNILIEWAYWNNWQVPILKDLGPKLALTQLEYPGEIKKTLVLTFTGPETFKIHTEEGKELGRGTLGQPALFGEVKFAVENPKGLSIAKNDQYLIVIEPLNDLATKIGKDLVINLDKDDKSLLQLQYKHRDRHLGKAILNALMRAYQQYLEDDHDLSSDIQVAYLERRQKDAGDALQSLMDNYVKNVAEDMTQSGFTSLQQEMDFLAQHLADNQQKLTEILLETKRLKNINCDECVHYDSYTGRGDPAIINHLLAEIRVLKQQSDALELALKKSGPIKPKEAFNGITLETSRSLYLAFIQELNQLEAEEKQHRFIIEQLKAPDFELSSLTALLHDPISQERIATVTQVVIDLKDENNRTQKELERLNDELALQKGFLTAHIQQMADLLQLKTSLLHEKIIAVQAATLDLTAQQISILKKNLSDYIRTRIENLNQEKILLEEHQLALHERMASIPPKWASEQLLNQNLALQQNFLENLANMVESKNITKNLEMVQSSPLDDAIAPLHPKPPRLLFFSVFGAALGCLGAAGYLFSRSLIKGVPASLDNLRLTPLHVSGKISPFQGDEISATAPLLDTDLDTLRRLIARYEQDTLSTGRAKLLLIAPGNGPDFSNTLAKLLAKKGQTTLKIKLGFQKGQEDTSAPGLLQYLEGKAEAPAIEAMEGFDLISSGGTSRYSEELLRSPRFERLLDKFKPNYDWIIGVTSAKVPSAEAENLAKLFDGMVLVVTNETLQNLVAFSNSLAENRKSSLTCVISS